jgi:hypothetical protein
LNVEKVYLPEPEGIQTIFKEISGGIRVVLLFNRSRSILGPVSQPQIRDSIAQCKGVDRIHAAFRYSLLFLGLR